MTEAADKLSGISYVMPALDEEENIELSVCRAYNALRENAREFEIIVVDDGSSDGTMAVLDRMKQGMNCLRTVSHGSNRGYGAALRSGFDAAVHEFVFFTDSDNQFDPGEIRLLIPLIQRCDFAVGYRENRADPFIRLFLAKGFNMLVRMMFGLRVRDIDCAFKLIRRSALESLRLESDDYLLNTEMLGRARAKGYSIEQAGVTHYPRSAGKSKIEAGDITRTLVRMLRIRRTIASE